MIAPADVKQHPARLLKKHLRRFSNALATLLIQFTDNVWADFTLRFFCTSPGIRGLSQQSGKESGDWIEVL
ncbi:MAG TPA: hypothetical protein VJZ27_07860, partial [Aggregatilineales bacterium]|nr:hypothetical protein [Aggregatilineales bacterium]